jgi:hypothetical protein
MEFDVALTKQHLESLARTQPLTGIIELIWNALDADATEIRVEFILNEIEGLEEIRVRTTDTASSLAMPSSCSERSVSRGSDLARDRQRGGHSTDERDTAATARPGLDDGSYGELSPPIPMPTTAAFDAKSSCSSRTSSTSRSLSSSKQTIRRERS